MVLYVKQPLAHRLTAGAARFSFDLTKRYDRQRTADKRGKPGAFSFYRQEDLEQGRAIRAECKHLMQPFL